MNPDVCFNARIVSNGSSGIIFHPGFQIKVPQYTPTRYILITTEATEQHENFNLFHLQYDRM